MAGQAVIDVTTTTFEEQVLDRSHTVPVVVDFWAPWCGPCRSLGPVLERLARSADGAWELVKINTDENQELARRFAIQSIPAVKAFVDGAVVEEFLGAQPESAVRAFLQKLVPSNADIAAAEAARNLASGNLPAAEAAFRSALAERADHPAALLGLARLLFERGELGGVEALLERMPLQAAEAREARVLLARIRFRVEAAASLRSEEALQRLSADPEDAEALYALGLHAAADGAYREALDRFLAVTERHRRFGNDAGRKAMIAVFEILGAEDPLTREYRPRLSAALH